MSECIKKHFTLIKLWPNITKTHKERILGSISKNSEFLKAIIECCVNLFEIGSSKLKDKCIKKYKKLLNLLRSSNTALNTKKNILKQKGRGLLTLLFSAVAPVLAKLIS